MLRDPWRWHHVYYQTSSLTTSFLSAWQSLVREKKSFLKYWKLFCQKKTICETWSLIGLKLIEVQLRSTGPFLWDNLSMMKRLKLMLREKFQIGLKSNTGDGIWSRASRQKQPVHICHCLEPGFGEKWHGLILLVKMLGYKPLIGYRVICVNGMYEVHHMECDVTINLP